jgi:hypothetical protein
VTRYRWVDSRKAEGFPVTQACAVAQVSPSAFHDWLTVSRHGPTLAESDEAYLVRLFVGSRKPAPATARLLDASCSSATLMRYARIHPHVWVRLRPVLERSLGARIQRGSTDLPLIALDRHGS